MAMFGGFKPEGMQKIANSMGFKEDINTERGLKSFNDYMLKDPARQQLMTDYTTRAIYMANGGTVPQQQQLQQRPRYDLGTPKTVLQPYGTASKDINLTSPTVTTATIPTPTQPTTTVSQASTTTPIGSFVPPMSTGISPPRAFAPTNTLPTTTPVGSFVPSISTGRSPPLTFSPTGTLPTTTSTTSQPVVQPRPTQQAIPTTQRPGTVPAPRTAGVDPNAATFSVPGSFQLYRPEYVDPRTGRVRADLLGGQHTDPNTIPTEVLQDRYRARELGFTGDFGEGAYAAFLQGRPETTQTVQQQFTRATAQGTPLADAFLDPNDPTKIDSRLLGGRFDASNISLDVLSKRKRFIDAGYTGGWGSGGANRWVDTGNNRNTLFNTTQLDASSSSPTITRDVQVSTPAAAPSSIEAPDVFLPTIGEREYTQEELDAGLPEFHRRIRTAFGFTGQFGAGEFNTFLEQYAKENPDAYNILDSIRQEYQFGALSPEAQKNILDISEDRLKQPALPEGAVTQAEFIPESSQQFIDPNTGQVVGDRRATTTQATLATTAPTPVTEAAQVTAATSEAGVRTAAGDIQAQTPTISAEAQVQAQQTTQSAVSALQGQQGQGIFINSPVNRAIQEGELISSVANAQTAATFMEQVQEATATPSTQATVQGQLATLTENFDASNPPSWAAGAIRAANQQMARRGLGSSSIAGQAIIQATLEAALPIAQADARTVVQFETQNLSNRQQRAMLAAEQRATFLGLEFSQEFQTRVQNAARIGDIAGLNFSAEQQVQLENSRIGNTINLQNLSNRQAVTIAEASALANLDQANLNNRQQAAVQNAQNFLQRDLTEASNAQQVEILRGQQIIQSLFTDQAARNTAQQINATSQNQVDQFFANLDQQTKQFNAAQFNAQAQFNAGQSNTVSRFNEEVADQRDRFNATNRLTIDQNNAVWRRAIATADTAAVNRANEINAAALLDISDTAYNDLFQLYSDQLDNAFRAGENALTRSNRLAEIQLQTDANAKIADRKEDIALGTALGSAAVKLLTSNLKGSLVGDFFNIG